MKVKLILATIVLGSGMIYGFTQTPEKNESEQEGAVSKAAEYKSKSREKIKPYRYDGSKISYFNYTTYEQVKSVEVLLFNGIDYKFCFNTDGVPKSIDIKIYDREALKNESDKGKRILLYEASGVMKKDIVITTAQLLKKLQESKSSITTLRKIFIEYTVPFGDKTPEAPSADGGKKGKDAPVTNAVEQGIVVVSYGYKNV
jgi:hypothetical protein